MSLLSDPSDRVRAAIQRLREAIIINVTDEGDVDFRLDDLDGFARERCGNLRVSFVIVLDPDPVEAAQFVRDHDAVGGGEAQFIAHGDGSFIRYLVELPFDHKHEQEVAAKTARALQSGWLHRATGSRDLADTLNAAGIALPTMGTQQGTALRTYGPWSWGSRYIAPTDLYMFEVGQVAAQLINHGQFCAVSHAGHGLNSYGLNLVTGSGPIAAFVQHAYGGVYTDPLRSLISINATYSRLRVLLGALEDTPAEDIGWLLVYSEFRGGAGLVDLGQVRSGESLDSATSYFDNESELFAAAADLPAFKDADFDTMAGVSW